MRTANVFTVLTESALLDGSRHESHTAVTICFAAILICTEANLTLSPSVHPLSRLSRAAIASKTLVLL